MPSYYLFLMQFTKGTTPCRSHLLKKYSSEFIDSAISKGYIIEIRKNDLNDPVYSITELGKQIRDN